MAGLIYKELWHDPKTCDWAQKWSSDIGWLWVKLISFADDHPKARGVMTELQTTTVCALNHIPQEAIKQLVEAKGLDAVEGGFRVHNYRKRGDLFKSRSDAGKKGAATRWQKPMANGMANEIANSHKQSAYQNYGDGDGVVKKIFQTWKGLLGRAVSLTPGRRRVIEARLKDGYSAADLCDAAAGWRNDPWPERPQHNDLTILFRNGEQVEKFRDLQRNGRPRTVIPGRAAEGVRIGQQYEALARAAESHPQELPA